MQSKVTRWSELDEADRRETLAEAASCLREGGLVIVPTETVYGVMASAADADAVERLRAEAGASPGSDAQDPGGPRSTWHAPDAEALRSSVALPTAVHRRLVAKLLPGPVRFVFEQEPGQIETLLGSLGVPPGVIDADGRVAVRVSSHPVARELIAEAGVPVIADRLGRTRWGGGPGGRTGDRAGDRAVGDTSGFRGVVIDDGPVEGSPSTTVHLALTGAISVDGAGAVKEKNVLDALKRRIVFVCTGNTCRSPMAAAIARKLLAERGQTENGVETVIESAGVATGDGLPASPEAVEVIAEMGGDLRSHRSRGLTREIVARADFVLAMTGSHLDRAKELSPENAGRMELIDPSGDVPDPIGGPVEVYRATAERLRTVIEARFQELGV